MQHVLYLHVTDKNCEGNYMKLHSLLAVFASVWLCLSPSFANASSWTLSNTERQAFLKYYAPIVFKRGNGNDGDHGRDWITNFDFDRDYRFSDNKREWKNIGRYIDASARGPNAFYERWKIRPTLYTSMIEYMDGGRKHLVLFYHIYHGMDENAFDPVPFTSGRQLHDWERVEIHIRNVSTSRRPGAGEAINFAVITQHKRSVMRRPSSPDFNTYDTPTGKHLLIWQAEWSGKLTGPHGQELRFIEDTADRIFYEFSRNKDAEVEIIANSNDKNVHYIFVPSGSPSAVSRFNARILNYDTARSLTSFDDNGKDIPWSRVKRIQYELQDIADIVPTHWAGGNFAPHWTQETQERIRIVSPVRTRENQTINGLQTFNTKSFDVEFEDGRDGYLSKPWFWGAYEIRDACDVNIGRIISGSTCTSRASQFNDNSFASIVRDDRGRTRTQANGDPSAARSHWHQHDYFVHSGVQDDRKGYERGFWLPAGWQLASNGGFDGRWVSLFPDNLNNDPAPPFSASVSSSAPSCIEFGVSTVSASGGQAPYTFTWTLSGSSSPIQTDTNVNQSSFVIATGARYVAVARDSAGASRSFNLSYQPDCRGPDGPFLPF